MKDCQKAAGLIILTFSLLLWGALPIAAETDAGSKSVDEYYHNKESNETSQADDDGVGQDMTKQEAADGEKVGITAGDVIKMIFALLFVICLLFLLLKFVGKKSRGFHRGQMIQNMGGAPLGGNRSLQVVRVGEKILVLGVGENVQLLDLIDDEKEYNRMIDEFNESSEPISAGLAPKWLQGRKGMRGTEIQSFAGQLSAQLEGMKAERKVLYENLRKTGSGQDE